MNRDCLADSASIHNYPLTINNSFEPRNPHVIQASEIGSFLYCRRAWGYQRAGETSGNQTEMLTGTTLHEQHGRTVLTAGLLRGLAYALLLFVLVLGTMYVLNQVFS